MVFSRFFGKDTSAPPRDIASAPEDEAATDEPEIDVGEQVDADDSLRWRERARDIIPGGASTGSKRPKTLYGVEPDDDMPTHFVRAAGCHVETAEGDTLIDCTMALGSVALGYAEPDLTRAVVETIANGSVSGLSPAHEVELAERFCGVVPCAERVMFLKTGADAMSAAVRIARTYTGRETVIGCGYFGWHDWASNAAGVPTETIKRLRTVPFDDMSALNAAVTQAGSDLAAIVIEPVVERAPSKEWLMRARELCDKTGAALIFDEMKTGFRVATGGYQQVAEVTPDLAAFGKALANGYPLAAVCGSRDLMDASERTWISSTLASEAAALTAALAVLAWHERVDVCASLASIGREMRDAVSRALEASGVSGVSVDGIDPMWFLRFDDPARESVFVQAAVRHGVLFKRGPYNFAALAHDDEAIQTIESAASAAFVDLRDHESA
jgi:glutamate-1-semialdehyde 2,1-aminomutase